MSDVIAIPMTDGSTAYACRRCCSAVGGTFASRDSSTVTLYVGDDAKARAAACDCPGAPVPPRWNVSATSKCLGHVRWPLLIEFESSVPILEEWEQEARDILAAVAWVRKNGARILAEPVKGKE